MALEVSPSKFMMGRWDAMCPVSRSGCNANKGSQAMSVAEEARYHLHQQLDEARGEEGATTMMEMLPPVRWADVATKRDLDQQSELLEHKIESSCLRLRVDFEKALRVQLSVILSALFSVAGILIALSIFGPR